MKWRRVCSGCYEARTAYGHYAISRNGFGRWALEVEGEPYSQPGLLSVLKNVAAMLDGDRQRRVAPAAEWE